MTIGKLGKNLGVSITIAEDAGSETAYQVDSAWVFETSGEAVFLTFISPVTQSSGTLDFYAHVLGSVTGTPTYKAELRNGAGAADDPDRPESAGSALATTGNVTPSADRWSTFSFTGVSLTEGQTYWIVIYNSHATPASNYCSWVWRGALDSNNYNLNMHPMFISGYTINGFTTDPSLLTGTAPMVVKFNDGSIIGNPYTEASSHAGDTNDRGFRLNLTASLKIFGFGVGAGTTAVSGFEINQNTTNILTVTSDIYAETRSERILFDEITLSASTDYDFVITFGSASTAGTIYYMGETSGNLPADVLACKMIEGYVDGTTPGSYTLDATKTISGAVIISDIVAGGAGGGMITHPGMSGGMRG